MYLCLQASCDPSDMDIAVQGVEGICENAAISVTLGPADVPLTSTSDLVTSTDTPSSTSSPPSTTTTSTTQSSKNNSATSTTSHITSTSTTRAPSATSSRGSARGDADMCPDAMCDSESVDAANTAVEEPPP
ncbi:hypothetical protein CVT24_005283 [Panaeolus cyanescens]|uniref:Uncharacterized protein n=1 Tax=Panaeolus cyanescens TaxID=181874 RepID=A0A409Y8Q9_9AGAR|nr:hypothetical protein CVT24_005283 [Panaeolus cyanescens]